MRVVSQPMTAADEPWYTKDIPTLFMSFYNPYHMFDVPFIGCFIKYYSSYPFCIEAAVSKLVGKSPINPWCDDLFQPDIA